MTNETIIEIRINDGTTRRFRGQPQQQTTVFQLGGGPVERLVVDDAEEILPKRSKLKTKTDEALQIAWEQYLAWR